MIDHLSNVLSYLEYLPPEAQEEAAIFIESLAEAVERERLASGRIQRSSNEIPLIERWEDPAGAWSDLPDDMLEELDRIRHANPPTPPLEDL